MSDETIYHSNDAVARLVAANLISEYQAGNLGRTMTPNYNQHIANMAFILKYLELDYAVVENTLGFPAGSMTAALAPVVTPEPVPGRSFAEVMAEAAAARDAGMPKVDPATLEGIMSRLEATFNQLVVTYKELQEELKKKL